MDDFQKVRFFLASIKKNREELYCAMMLVYLCGLQKKEIVSIKIEDITDQNNCYLINIDDKGQDPSIEVKDEAYDILKEYLSNLEKNQKLNVDSFLFPNYIGDSGKTSIQEDLKTYPNCFNVRAIQAASLKAFNKDLSGTISDYNQRIKQIAIKFRKSPRAVKDQLKNTIKPPGKTKDDLMREKLISFHEEISLLNLPNIEMKIKTLTDRYNKHLIQCKYDEKKIERVMGVWGKFVSKKLSELKNKAKCSHNKTTITNNNYFTSKIKFYHVGIQFTAKHHALLFSSITEETFNLTGEQKGEAVICEAVQKYGQQCGARMAFDVQNNGENLSIFNYLIYRKWEMPPYTMFFKLIEKTPNIQLEISKCPWYKVWGKNELLKYGKYYCKEIHTALAHGFNPNLKIEIDSIQTDKNNHSEQTNKNNSCDFIFKDTYINNDEFDLGSKYKKTLLFDTATNIPWEYAVAHLFKTMGEVIKQNLGHAGDTIMTNALINFENILTNFKNKNFFPNDYIEIIQDHANTNFDLEPNFLHSHGTTTISLVRESKPLRENKTSKSINRTSKKQIRVYELAKKLRITNKHFLQILKKSNIEVQSHMSSLNKTDIKTIKNKYHSIMKEKEKKDLRRQWMTKNNPETKRYNIITFREDSADFTKDMDSCELQQKNELLASFILRRLESFQKIEKITTLNGIPCDFLGFKNNIPHIIIFKCFSKSFNTPNREQKRILQEILEKIKNLEIEIVLLQIKTNQDEYRIFYKEKIIKLFVEGFKPGRGKF